MSTDLSGQTVLVTGGTRGIGAAIADAFASSGAELVLTTTDGTHAEALNEAASQHGERRVYYAVDFTDVEQTDAFLEKIGRHRIDVCVNNAGTNHVNPVAATDLDHWRTIQAVNLEAPLKIIKTVAPQMKERVYGRIVNIGSIFGVISRPGRALYSMSKFGLHGLTVATALELAPNNVLVNSVSPGFVRTQLTERILSPREIDELSRAVPMGRFAEPEEIATTVLFLGSPANSYITAQNIVIDGGFISA